MLSLSVNTSGLCLFEYKNKLSSAVTQPHVTPANVIASVTAKATLVRASIYVFAGETGLKSVFADLGS